MEMRSVISPPPIIEVLPPNNPKKVKLFIKREDLIHPIISGNKWRKLKYNLQLAQEQGHKTLLTFGGAYSNHIYALAGAAAEWGFKSIGIIRGEEHLPLNPTLAAACQMGMQLKYMNRGTYRQKHSRQVIDHLRKEFGDFYLIPEGGTNELALKGAAEIVAGIENDYDFFCVACGTGGTAAGMILGLKGTGQVLGFSVLKGDFHKSEISNWLKLVERPDLANWQVNTSYHFGGYAKYDLALVKFINSFRAEWEVPLDPIYTGKLIYGIYDLIAKGLFPENSRVLAIHTGGLQGISGFNQRFNNLINI